MQTVGMRYWGRLMCLFKGHNWLSQLEGSTGLVLPIMTCSRCRRHP